MPDAFAVGEHILTAYDAATCADRGSRLHTEKACTYIQTYLSDDLSLDAVNEAVFISKCHLCAIFRSLVGCTFGDYVRQQRLTHARLPLTTTTQSEEIAQVCGFQSVTYFAAIFKGRGVCHPCSSAAAAYAID